MGDSWEDNDDVPVVPQPVVLPSSKGAWDDEEEDEAPDPAKLAAEAEKKRQAEEKRKAKAAKDREEEARRRRFELQAEELENETPVERALRLKKQEERDAARLTGDLFGLGGVEQPPTTTTEMSTLSDGSQGGGVGYSAFAFNPKSSADYLRLGREYGPKFKTGASKDVAAFFTEVLSKGAKDALVLEDLNEIIKKLQQMVPEKERQAQANANKIGTKQKTLSTQKKKYKEAVKKTEEVFGGEYYENDPHLQDKYFAIEDDFM